ncbi:hypothetical protein [Thermosediminibacter oceani]|uniref:Uncharacterized protein n=1 Tax=Thermosediminibacter oceani (strain ATCC BAA-1034 / DSM 16646 / JW/IW-1228P) TaxID=555079 RepID=D9S1J7_THEOJ|nr:hypothetical protein [Thermosediminibacter oceani]ADL07274.1 hypothetical protein Toce_0498 [Thermosediminibacter oceani DSM 16646]
MGKEKGKIPYKAIIITLALFLALIISAYHILVNEAFDLVFPDHPGEVSQSGGQAQPPTDIKSPDLPRTPEVDVHETGSEEGQTSRGTPPPKFEKPEKPLGTTAGKAIEDISIDEISGNISFSDKRRILWLVVRRLTSDDIKYLLGLLKGGLTESEKEEAKKIAFSRFTPEEIQEIRSLYHKYKHLTE